MSKVAVRSRGSGGRGAALWTIRVLALGGVGKGADVSRHDNFPVGLSFSPRLYSWWYQCDGVRLEHFEVEPLLT